MRKTTFVSGIVVAAICVCTLFQYRESREDNEGKEGFTQLLYSRIRPQARSARLLYAGALDAAFKHIDRIKYNLGMR